MRKETRSNLEYACLSMESFRSKRKKLLPEAFLRPAYKYTVAEVKDRTQEEMHEYDYRRGL